MRSSGCLIYPGVCPVLLAANESSLKRTAIQLRCRAVIVNPGTDDDTIRKSVWLTSAMECDAMHVVLMDKRSPGKDATSVQNLIGKSDNIEEVIRIQDYLHPERVAILYCDPEYTSSYPEVVSQSHFAFVNNTLAANTGLWDLDSRLYDDRPFVKIHSGLLSAVCLGLTIIHANSSTTQMAWDDSFLFSIMQRERVTACVASWAIIDKAVRTREARPVLSGYPSRILFYGIADGDDRLEFCRKTFKQTILFYCNTESGIAARRVISKETSIVPEMGYLEAVPYTELKVTDDEGKIRPLGCEGLLCIRSPYANSVSQMTRMWIRTGHLAVIHKGGGIQVTGKKEKITVRSAH